MSNRIDRKFKELKAAKKKALILFITAGHPDLKKTEQLIYAFEKEGADIIEIGVPFSDPLADGPVIQESSRKSLLRNTNLTDIMRLVGRVRRKSSVPLVLMSYLNPILRYGTTRFIKDCARLGVDGFIIPELPPEEEASLRKLAIQARIHLIYLAAPTSTAKRREMISRSSKGFVYFVSVTGVTGVKKNIASQVFADIVSLKKRSPLPVCVGFGVSDAASAKRVAAKADGVIIGSAIVKQLDRYPRMDATSFAKRFIRPFAKALGKRGA